MANDINIFYSDCVLQHFYAPQHVGELAPGVGVFVEEKVISGGDRARLSVLIENAHIRDIRYCVLGSPALIASFSCLATEVIGKALTDAENITAQAISQRLHLPLQKQSCAILAVTLLHAIIHKNNFVES